MATLLAGVARGERLPDTVRAWFHELIAEERRAKNMHRKLVVKVEEAIAPAGFYRALGERVRLWWPRVLGTAPHEETIRSSLQVAHSLLGEAPSAILRTSGSGSGGVLGHPPNMGGCRC